MFVWSVAEDVSGQVVDCLAHDGLGDTSQALIDPEGCPVDEVLVPRLREAPALGKRLQNYRLTVLTTSFPAFKFPDRDSVHIRCGMQLCRGRCHQVTYLFKSLLGFKYFINVHEKKDSKCLMTVCLQRSFSQEIHLPTLYGVSTSLFLYLNEMKM